MLVLRAAGRRPRRAGAGRRAAGHRGRPVALQHRQRAGRRGRMRRAGAVGARASRSGLRSFAQDAAANPGRLNLFERRRRASSWSTSPTTRPAWPGCWTCPGADRRPARKVRLAFGTAGDRTDEILTRARRAWRAAADDLVIAEKRHYLRGRDLEEMNELLRAGGARGRLRTARSRRYRDEVAALRALLGARAARRRVRGDDPRRAHRGLRRGWSPRASAPVGPDRLREVARAPGRLRSRGRSRRRRR